MKTTQRFLAAILGLALLAGCSAIPETAADRSAAIEEVIGQVQAALAKVQTKLAEQNFPPLKDVKLTLQTVVTRKAGGEIKLGVANAQAGWEKARTQQISITLVPPPAGHLKLGLEPSLTEDFEAAILSAADGLQKARSGPVPLVASAVEVEIDFTVKLTGGGGGSVALLPVTLGADASVSAATVQNLRLEFALK